MATAITDESIIEVQRETSLSVIDAGASDLSLRPVMSLSEAEKRLKEFQGFVKFYLHEGEDFGTIPGTPKPTLYKPGADKLCDLYGLADDYEIVRSIVDFDKGLFDYEIKCILTKKGTSVVIATGMGSCSSWEGKYRWRELKRICPQCSKATIIKGRKEFGGGWICWKKEGKSDGCGAKFKDGDQSIEGQQVGRVENDDLATVKNTILKMSKKRAKVDAVLSATRSSGIFTQDVEDLAGTRAGEEYDAKAVVVAEKYGIEPEKVGTKEAAEEVARLKLASMQGGQDTGNAGVATPVADRLAVRTTEWPEVHPGGAVDRGSNPLQQPTKPPLAEQTQAMLQGTQLKSENTIGARQVRAFWATAREQKWSEDGVRELLREHGFESTRDILQSKFTELVEALTAKPPAEQAPVTESSIQPAGEVWAVKSISTGKDWVHVSLLSSDGNRAMPAWCDPELMHPLMEVKSNLQVISAVMEKTPSEGPHKNRPTHKIVEFSVHPF